MDILQATRKLRPGTAWHLRGGKLLQAEDGTPRVSIPTTAELQAVMNAEVYKDKRAEEYPDLRDQLDALWKGGDDLEAMRSTIMAVKAKYPKPQ